MSDRNPPGEQIITAKVTMVIPRRVGIIRSRRRRM
jgi:hypothetical protein